MYILKSINRNWIYTGCTDNLKRRFIEHNNSAVKSTKPYAPFVLIYYEACLDKTDGFLREKYLKSRLGKTYLNKRLKNWFKINKRMPMHI